MIKGVTVQVIRPSVTGYDSFGNEVEIPGGPQTVDNVLVAPGPTAELEAARPQGVTVAYSLHFPKTYTASLEGCSVVLPEPWADTYRVIGNPTPYMASNTPGMWDRPVEVEVAHG